MCEVCMLLFQKLSFALTLSGPALLLDRKKPGGGVREGRSPLTFIRPYQNGYQIEHLYLHNIPLLFCGKDIEGARPQQLTI